MPLLKLNDPLAFDKANIYLKRKSLVKLLTYGVVYFW